MNEQKRALFIELLDEISNFFENSHESEARLVELIQHCLKIVATLSEQSAQVYNIAKSLSMIAKFEQKRSLGKNLGYELAMIEQGLEAELRGFSSLLDLVLLENNIKVDIEQIEFFVPQRLQHLARIFSDLHRQLDAYSCLGLAFGEANIHALTLLFLIALKRVLSHISSDEKWAFELIEHWLSGFIKNRAI